MSFHEQNFNAFIHLIQTQASLFSAQDWANLSERIATCPEEVEQLSEAISAWCQERPQILQALRQKRKDFSSGQSTTVKAPGVNMGKKPPLAEKHPKQILVNAIQQSSATSSSKSTTSGS